MPAMPPQKDDPSIVAGRAAKLAFTAKAAGIRSDPEATDLAKARQVVDLWDRLVVDLGRRRADLVSRRRARLAELEEIAPTGANVDPATTPADRAVLLKMFQDATDRARDADPATLMKMYRDAMRFDDQLVQRAVFTVGLQDGRAPILDAYLADHPEVRPLLDELGELGALLAGTAPDGWAVQALSVGPPMGSRRPEEVATLPVLEQAETRRQDALRGRR